MPNPSYQKGVKFEREVRDLLTSWGWWVTRSGHSRTPVDLVALRLGAIMLIQCKTHDYLAPAEREELRNLAVRAGGKAFLAGKRVRGKVTFRQVMAAGLVEVDIAATTPDARLADPTRTALDRIRDARRAGSLQPTFTTRDLVRVLGMNSRTAAQLLTQAVVKSPWSTRPTFVRVERGVYALAEEAAPAAGVS
jgi:Holliday junction resolvase